MGATAAVKVYTSEMCPYCLRAKALLQSRGVAYEEILIPWDDDQAWDELTARSGLRTVPQIFAGEKLIGGYSELTALDHLDQLASLKAQT